MSVNDACRIVIDDSRVMLQIVASLTDDSGVVIYDCDIFTIQATSCSITYNHNMFLVQATSLPFPDLRRRRRKKKFIIFVKLL